MDAQSLTMRNAPITRSSAVCVAVSPKVSPGTRFGELVSLPDYKKEKHTWVLCQCDCGQKKFIRSHHLLNGKTRSCGHWRKFASPSWAYRLTFPVEYKTWRHMMFRCSNRNTRQWRWYGAKGVRVCERWQDFKNFLRDMGVRPSGMSIDRIDSGGNYEPENCRWLSCSENTRRAVTGRRAS